MDKAANRHVVNRRGGGEPIHWGFDLVLLPNFDENRTCIYRERVIYSHFNILHATNHVVCLATLLYGHLTIYQLGHPV